MEDQLIIKKFNERSEEAIRELSDKYGTLCKAVANRITGNEQDAEECLNDALLAVWNNVPPESPDPLSTYVCRITRNLSLKKYHANTAKKRDTRYDLVLEELEECLAGDSSVEDEILAKELQQSMNDFLPGLKKTDRIIFVKRYWFLESVSEIADSIGRNNNYVTVHLHRSRKKLEDYLKRKGLIL